MKQQKRLFNKWLFLYNKYKRKKQNLAARGQNQRRQAILEKHIERLHEKLNTLYAGIKKATVATALVAGALAFQPSSAQAQTFNAVQSNPFGLTNIGWYSTSAFTDLDNDGDMDIMSGDSVGNFKYFQNTGTASAPSFAAVQTNPFGLTKTSDLTSPAFADLDNDGDMDMMVGDFNGNFYYIENTGTVSLPSFGAKQTNPFLLTGVSTYKSSPAFADLDKDGDLDMMSGEKYGNFQYFQNTGSASAPSFAALQTNPFNLTDIGAYSAPTFADLDNDGDMDMLSGDFSAFYYFENTGTASAPSFAASQINPYSLSFGFLGYLNYPSFADLDKDGDLDVLSGDLFGNFNYFERSGHAGSKLTSASCGSTLTNLSQRIYCAKINTATNYRYKLEHAASSFSVVKSSTDTSVIVGNIPGIGYGKTYDVRVSCYSSGRWSPYGPVCTITTPAVQPKLTDASCGAVFSSLNQKVFCKKITAATNYRYKVEHVASSFSATKVSTDTSIVLSGVSGIGYGKTYSVSMSYFSNGVWSPFGPVCNVTTPAEPKLAAASCGTTLTNLSQKLFGRSIAGSTNYKYKIEHAASSFSTTKVSADTSFALSTVAGIEYGKTYTISVSYYNGTWSPFGSACNVTTPATEPMLTNAFCGTNVNGLSQQKVLWKAIGVATNYKFKIEHAGTSFIRIVTTGSTDTSIALSSVAGVEFGKTYTIQIAYFSDGVWSPFGAVCNVTIEVPTIPLAPDNDGEGQPELNMASAQTMLGIDDLQTFENVVVYPNPVVDLLTIIGSENYTQVEVMNVLGQTVLQQSNKGKQNNLVLNVSELPEGTYFVKMKDDQNNITIRKIAKK